MPELEILATGWWCVNCEFFETDDPNIDGDCASCGCSPAEHHSAAVVRTDA